MVFSLVGRLNSVTNLIVMLKILVCVYLISLSVSSTFFVKNIYFRVHVETYLLIIDTKSESPSNIFLVRNDFEM